MNADDRWQVWCRKRFSRDAWLKAGDLCQSKAEAINYISDTQLKGGVYDDLEWRVMLDGQMPPIDEMSDRYKHRMMRPSL